MEMKQEVIMNFLSNKNERVNNEGMIFQILKWLYIIFLMINSSVSSMTGIEPLLL